MITTLPEMPAFSLLPPGPGAAPTTPAGDAGGLDFAGLLGAALPSAAPQAPVNAMAVVTLSATPVQPEGAAPDAASLMQTGKILPLPGAELPEAPALPQPAALVPVTLEALAQPAPVLLRELAPASDLQPCRSEGAAAPAPSEQGVAKPAPEVEAADDLPPEGLAEVPESKSEAPAKPDAPERQSAQPDPAVALALIPATPVAQPPAVQPVAASPAQVAAEPILAVKRSLTPRLALLGKAAVVPEADAATPAPRAGAAAKPAQQQQPASPLPQPAAAVAAPLLAALADEAAEPPADADAAAVPAAGASPQLPPTLAALVPTQTPAATQTLLRTEPRAETPAPQQQSAIDHVGTLREAMRATRPAMTLQHAEFGAVSLRLEATGSEGWRAVLASRDPGFVPAIQTALADRAVAAAAAASPDSGSFMGQPGAGQGGASHYGTGDHRSGSTPNGGQGTPQPYFGQSGSRDGEAAPDHRRPSTTAALAARAEAEDTGPGSPAQGSGGLFA